MLRLKILLLLILIAVISIACSEGKPPQSQGWSEATGAEALERNFWKSIKDGDVKELQRHIAPIFTLTVPAGIQGRDQALQSFQNLQGASVNLADLEVKPQGSDMVVSYVAVVTAKSAPTRQRYYMTTVWQQGKKGWMATTHSEVPASGS
jgi:hypothetical protein